MAWSATDNFESYSAGTDINGGSGGTGWTGNWVGTGANECTVQTAPSGMSGNALRVNWISGDGGDASRTFTAITEGTVSFKMSASQTDKLGRFTLTDSTVPISRAYIRFDGDGNIKAVGSGSTTLQAYSANTVYSFKIKFGHTSGNFAVSIDGGAYSSDMDMAGTGSQVDKINIVNEQVTTSVFYVDDIADGEAAGSAKVPSLTLLGVS